MDCVIYKTCIIHSQYNRLTNECWFAILIIIVFFLNPFDISLILKAGNECSNVKNYMNRSLMDYGIHKPRYT